MIIRDVEAIPLVLVLDTPFEAGTYRVSNRNTIVVRLTTDQGIEGEVYGGDEDMCQGDIVELINGAFTQFITGRAVDGPEDIEAIYRDLMNYPIDLGYRALVDLDMGRHGIQQQALSLVDMALWDALGKTAGKPVHELLGGALRDRIPVIAIGGYYHDDEPQGTFDEVRWLRDQGVSGIKMKVGRVAFEKDVERIRAAFEAGGGDFTVAVDVNQGWTVEQVRQFCRDAADLGLAWLEEPVKWYDCLTGLAEVRKESTIPIVSGQGDISEYRSCDLVRYGAVDQLNTDATLVGGITGWMHVADFAASRGVAMGHHEEPQVSLTLLSVVNNIGPVEIFADERRDPLWKEILRNAPTPDGGTLPVPQGPGLGIELDRDVIERLRVS